MKEIIEVLSKKFPNHTEPCMETIITIAVLIISIVLHEVAHGYAANWLGDPTARLAG
jgi:hypothetical protein